MKKTAALILLFLLLSSALCGCLGQGVAGKTYKDAEEGIILSFDDVLYILTEDDVTAHQYQIADGILFIGEDAHVYSLSEDEKTLTVDDEVFERIRSFPVVEWRLIRFGSEVSIGQSATGVLGWLTSPFAFQATNSIANNGLLGALLVDAGIILVIVILVRTGLRISRRRAGRK